MSVRILTGDCRAVLATLPSESVQCILTSPPYYGLRDYQTASWEGGEPGCDHLQGRLVSPKSGLRNDGREHVGPYDGEKMVTAGMPFRSVCGKCGARRIDRQIGLEQTPDAYVAEMVAVFRECRRVLRDDGVCFVNLGDSYASKPAGSSGYQDGRANREHRTSSGVPAGLKPKDLLGIPWRLAFALQADGWYLRQDIIWAKPNAMPESVRDRCTKSHEYVFMLSKSARYWYDAAAIDEPSVSDHPSGNGFKRAARLSYNGRGQDEQWNGIGGSRNRRSVWTIATEPSVLPHFAMMPTALAELCIKAGCPKGGTVLDPFGGAGTTGLVADRLGRNAILIELNPANTAMAQQRLEGDAGMFADVSALQAAE